MTSRRRNRVDLHCHSARSDGVDEPRSLYGEMRRYGMRLVAVSDHDTLAGYRELRAAGLGERPSASGPQLIPAVEINTLGSSADGLGGGELHVLGYGVDADDEDFERVLERQRAARRVRFALLVERLRELGMPIDEVLPQALPDDLTSAGRPHAARALVLAGFASSVDDAMQRLLVPGAGAYVPRRGIGTRDAIEAIVAAGGLASLAHFAESVERPDVVERLQGWGLGGLEVHYAGFDAATIAALARLAEDRSLVATGGSDYHGDTMSYAEAQGWTFVPDRAGERLLEALGAR